MGCDCDNLLKHLRINESERQSERKAGLIEPNVLIAASSFVVVGGFFSSFVLLIFFLTTHTEASNFRFQSENEISEVRFAVHHVHHCSN